MKFVDASSIWDSIEGTGLVVLVNEMIEDPGISTYMQVQCFDTSFDCQRGQLGYIRAESTSLRCETASRTVGNKHYIAFVLEVAAPAIGELE